MQSYYDVTNAVAEAQHEINKELRASQSMYEYLNEETRKLLFNQEDYDVLTAELIDIQEAANALQEQYNEDILGASKEAIAEITSQYQMQYDTMMKQYEVAKAELEVAKKRQKLDSVLAERNVRMFINGQWQWVANTQDVIDAKNELADAEIEKEKAESDLEQTESLNKLTESQDNLTTQINYLGTDLQEVRDKWSEMQEMLSGESDEVAEVLREISNITSPELQRVILTTGGSLDGFSEELSESTTTLSEITTTDLGNASLGISAFTKKLEEYSATIKSLAEDISSINIDKDNNNISVKDTIAQMQANSEKWSSASESEQQKLHDLNKQLGDSIGATYDEKTGKWHASDGSLLYSSSSSGSESSPLFWSTGDTRGSSSSKGSSSSSSSSSAKEVNTADQYVKSSSGNIQSNPNWDGKEKGGVGSFYKYAKGTRYTPGGLTLMGEEGFEAFISGNGRLIPITQPTIGNIGAGGIVFNREQMANLRNLWDLGNLGKMPSIVSSSNTNKQDTIIDNSIHINGLTVGEQGNEDWINGLRRYVATHK